MRQLKIKIKCKLNVKQKYIYICKLNLFETFKKYYLVFS